MIDFDKAKTILIEEFKANGSHSEIEILAFHSGLNYLIDYISNEEDRPLNDYVPDEIVYNKENSRRAIKSIRQEFLKKEKNIIEKYRLLLKVKEILLERRLEALRIKMTKEAEQKCQAIRNEYEERISKYTQLLEKQILQSME